MKRRAPEPLDTRLDDATVLRIASALRAFAFFEDADDDAVLKRHHRSAYDQGRLATRWDAEAHIAALDDGRVACFDTECDPQPSSRTYVRLLQKVAGVSRGALADLRVEERWLPRPPEGTEYPVELHVAAGQRKVAFMPVQFRDSVAPADLAAGLNALLPPEGPRLEHLAGTESSIVAVTQDERRALVAQRGWRFAEPGEPIFIG